MTFSTHPECIVLTKGEIKRLQGPDETAHDHMHTSKQTFLRERSAHKKIDMLHYFIHQSFTDTKQGD